MSAKTPHVHAAVIKAWADGATIQWRCNLSKDWLTLDDTKGAPVWATEWEYRVKPEPKPDIVKYWLATYSLKEDQVVSSLMYYAKHANIKCIFDGETGQLKSVELIK